MNLKPLSNLNFKSNNTRFIGILLIFSFFGFLDASYLTIIHYKNIIPPCSLAKGCETVLSSTYASFMGVPVAIFGIIFYVCMIGLTLFYARKANKKTFLSLSIGAILGLIVSFVLFYIQAFLLHAYCQYCLASEAFTIVIGITILVRYLSAQEMILEKLM